MCWKGGRAISAGLNNLIYCKGSATHDGTGKPIKINKDKELPRMPRGFLKRITELFGIGRKTNTDEKKCGDGCNLGESLILIRRSSKIPELRYNDWGIPEIKI